MCSFTRERIRRDDQSGFRIDHHSRVLARVDLKRAALTVDTLLDFGRILHRIEDRIGFGPRSLCAVADDPINTVLRETSNRGPILGDDACPLCGTYFLAYGSSTANRLHTSS